MSKKATSLIWLHSHFNNWMGGTKFIFEVTRRLNKEFNLFVVVEQTSSYAVSKYRSENMKLVSLKSRTSSSYLYWLLLPYYIFKDYVLLNKILKNIKGSKSDIVIISNMFPMNLVACLFRAKHVQYCFEPFAFFYDNQFINNFSVVKKFLITFLGFFWKPFDIWATKRSSRVLTLNQTTSNLIKNVYGITPIISLAGIDTNHFKHYVSKKLLRKYAHKKIVVHSTDYSPIKGTDRMIKIFAKVKEDVPSAYLLITSTIKNAHAKANLEQLARDLKVEDSVEFLGFVDYKTLPQIYSLAKILVQCSTSLGSGTTSMALPVKEAMACETLPIRYPIKSEDVVNNVSGFFVNPMNFPKMVSTIIRVLNMNGKMYNSMAKKARSFIKENYTWENTCQKISQVISSSDGQ